MRYQSRLRGGVRGPLEAFVPGFTVELGRLGYTPVSASLQLNLMAHLSRWLMAEGVDAAGLSDEAVERFMAGRRADGFTNHRTARSLGPLLGYLRSLGVTAPSVRPAPDAVEVLLDRYRVFCSPSAIWPPPRSTCMCVQRDRSSPVAKSVAGWLWTR